MPCAIRWPGVIKPGTVINEIGAHEDMMATLLAAAGDPTAKEDLLTGRNVGEMTYKVYLDGYNLMPALKGEGKWPRHEFIYWTDDGSVAALRYGNWKATFLRQDAHGLHVWQEPFTALRAPMLTNLLVRKLMLKPATDGFLSNVKIRATQTRVYVLTAAILDGVGR